MILTYWERKKGSTFFRVYHYAWRTATDVAEEVRLLNYLKEKGISISYPILDITENHVQVFEAIEGERYGVLFSFAEGKKESSLSPELHAKLGTMMATMHLHTQDFQLQRLTYNSETLVLKPFDKINPFLYASSDASLFLNELNEVLVPQLNTFENTITRRGAVHLDMWSDNLHVSEVDKITLFDFDFCGNGWLILDIAYHLMMLYAFSPNDETYLEKEKHFLNAYKSITPLTKEEKAAIPALGASLYFFYLGVQCERFAAVFVNENYVQQFITSRIQKWWDFYKKKVS